MISPSLTHVKKRCQQYPCACGFICDAKIPNKLSSAIAGERLLYLSSNLVVLVSFAFLFFYLDPHYLERSYPLKASLSYGIYYISFSIFFLLSLPPLSMEKPSYHSLSASRGEFNEPPSSSTSGYEPCPDLIAMVQEFPFSG